MRRTVPHLIVTAVAAALVLAACSSGEPAGSEGSEEPTSSASGDTASGATEATDLFEASGAFGEKPTLTFPGETPPEGLQAEVLSEGDGPVVEPGSVVAAHYLGQVWGSDTPFDNSYDGGAAVPFSLNTVVAGWTQGIPGHAVGSRILLSIPADLGYGPQGGNAQAGIGAEDTIVFVVDIVEAFGPEVVGEAGAEPTGEELPVTYDGELGEPVSGVTLVEGATLAAEPTSTTIATGTGEPIAAGQGVVAQYALTSEDGASQASTWDTSQEGFGPIAAAVGSGTFLDLVEGVPIGSRVLVQLPGNDQQPSALAVVVDLVAVAPQG
ncbi:peptidylprolyl isomerase FKBP-type [Beutenbergia cavernae DSM 12333]|uniref:peptidylprolyl isomerase n=1 Tax=Beutenbergia cavernae (strain ATCC BAA-8 / DSM 12333 / CCUG 43141 / JCM 11478 / NBRC 16432 / NCIMB 13614 / HKI 0122) TaxID=471853 RepID=C5C512_BEUC1|nr:peptidylprolyl isomerase FKBP-type [Beutenbergia cavernae DSM 12333]